MYVHTYIPMYPYNHIRMYAAQVGKKDERAPWILHFDGINTIANVSINGKVIGSTNSAFVAYDFTLQEQDLDADGPNTLEVTIFPVLEYAIR